MSREHPTPATITRVLAVTIGGGFISRLLLRDSVLTWGATRAEAGSRLPGDELLEDAAMVSTRAISIDAPASAVWPWLVQMGVGRGGAYTYDWIERLLGLDMHSADEVIHELQDVHVGDLLPMAPGASGLRVEIADPERVFTLRSEDGRWVWSFVLTELEGSTRLVSRNRAPAPRSATERIAGLIMEPGSLVMERKMLIGIKCRAEQPAQKRARASYKPSPAQEVENGRDVRRAHDGASGDESAEQIRERLPASD
ncbi:MAG: hypothetical protein QOF12_652 [Solirubrobacteraceae bacterium]|jgi:hypothetical protein|nr:hypothetical protein [Solirubrobacteraceae bacterium]